MVVSRAAGRLKVGFRRDIQWFLGALVGFLVVVNLILLLLLQSFAQRTEEVQRAQWTTIATIVSDSVDSLADGSSDQVVESQLTGLRAIYSIPALDLHENDGRTITSGGPTTGLEELTKETRRGAVSIFFDGSGLRAQRRTLLLTAVIVIASSLVGTVLLFLYIPRILRPIDLMLDEARELGERDAHVGEDSYLIETFKRSIATLKVQEVELRRLHAEQKSRADDLELVSATLTRSIGSGFIALDHDRRIVDMNRNALEILGLPDDVAVAGADSGVVMGDRIFGQHLREAFDARESLVRAEIFEPDSQKTIGLTTVPLVDEGSRFLGMLALFTDLTQIRDLEARVREMQTLADLGEMSAGIAHEFRNSLSTILGYLKLARRQSDPAGADSRIERAESEAASLATAIDSLLSFARPIDLRRAPVDLRAIAEEVADDIRNQFASCRIEIEGPPAEMEGDRALLRRIFENLLRNAAEAIEETGRPGTIRISVSDAPWPGVAIADDGVGIDAHQAGTLFVPFHSDKKGGIGLGLALTRKIVLVHGGTIDVTSREGGGTVVRIAFRATR